MHIAAACGHYEYCQELIRRGVPVNVLVSYLEYIMVYSTLKSLKTGETPLHLALITSKIELIK